MYGFGSYKRLKNYTTYKALLFYHNRHVRTFVTLEKLVETDSKLDILETLFNKGTDLSSIHKVFRTLKRKANYSKFDKKITRVIGDDGLVAGTKFQDKLVFREHFASQLGGSECLLSDLVVNDLNSLSMHDRAAPYPPSDGILDSLPGLNGLAQYFALASKGAFGEDKCPGKISKKIPRLMAAFYYPLVFKTFCRLQPPIQWMGGILHELFKNKGSSAVRGNYRDILLGNVDGKCVTKHVRSILVPVAFIVCGDSQFGSGMNGGETAFAHLYVRLVVDYCKFHKQSVAFIFADIVTAFAVLLRNFFFTESDCDESWLKKLRIVVFVILISSSLLIKLMMKLG